MILTRVLGLPQSIEIDQRPDKKFRQGFIGAGCRRERRQVTGSLARSLRGSELVPYEGRGVPRGRARGVVQVFCPPLCGVECRGLRSTLFCSRHPVFLPALQKWQLGLPFVYFGPDFDPTAHAGSFFQSHAVSLSSVPRGEMCPSANTAALQQSFPVRRPVS